MDEKESVLSADKEETHPRKFVRSAVRWTLVTLLAFGLGALLITFVLYIPTQQKLIKANADLEHANATITSKADQITTMQTDNAAQQKNLDFTTQHLYLLEALSGVRAASLAAAADDYAGARLSLIQASEALVTLSGLQVGTDQKDVFSAMQQSAAQALTDMKTKCKSAQPELDQLTKNLVQLETSLFPNP